MKFIPNILTLANAAFGCFALFYVANFDFEMTTLCILLAAAFDFFDGFIARAKGWTTRFGLELDSLADLISFGVVPGALATLMLKTINIDFPLIFLGFVITLSSAFRLAKYNIIEEHEINFRGLPTPANALIWVGVPHLGIDLNFPLILSGIIITSYLLNSPIIFYRFQIKNSLSSLIIVLITIMTFFFLWARFSFGAFTFVVIIYIASSILYHFVEKSKE